MKFAELTYRRPNITEISNEFNQQLQLLNKSTTLEEQILLIDLINKLRNEFDTASSIAHVRYTQNTSNKSYQEEQNFFDENVPVFTGLVVAFYKAIIASPFKKQLAEKYGNQLFSIANTTVETFSESIINDLTKENQLTSEYTKLISSAKINFDGKILTLSELAPYASSPDRETRKKANEARYHFFSSNTKELDRIYAELVSLRTNIAQKLGYKNFIELGYKRMNRNDYNAKMVAFYREQVLKYIVPICEQLHEKQAKRLNINEMKYYDESLSFKTGNANPKGDSEWIVQNAQKMYEELSSETKEFFDFMIDNEMMDLVSRQDKAPGGYCTFFSNYKSPFIFSNFNGTTHDIIVLTHEAGHAFQGYKSRNFNIPEYYFPTLEACEIHSMSMEFLTWPWMNLFFNGDTEKFKYSHISKAIFFLPYGVAVDEFQHWVYENYEATPKERKAAWRSIEKKYIPYRKYENNTFLEEGGYWQQQAHIFASPFYYIDYTLAQVCAFQFWQKANKNREKAMKDYIRLCEAGGSKSFLELVDLAELTSPFKGGCLESVANEVSNWLETIDDSKL